MIFIFLCNLQTCRERTPPPHPVAGPSHRPKSQGWSGEVTLEAAGECLWGFLGVECLPGLSGTARRGTALSMPEAIPSS